MDDNRTKREMIKTQRAMLIAKQFSQGDRVCLWTWKAIPDHTGVLWSRDNSGYGQD